MKTQFDLAVLLMAFIGIFSTPGLASTIISSPFISVTRQRQIQIGAVILTSDPAFKVKHSDPLTASYEYNYALNDLSDNINTQTLQNKAISLTSCDSTILAADRELFFQVLILTVQQTEILFGLRFYDSIQITQAKINYILFHSTFDGEYRLQQTTKKFPNITLDNGAYQEKIVLEKPLTHNINYKYVPLVGYTKFTIVNSSQPIYSKEIIFNNLTQITHKVSGTGVKLTGVCNWILLIGTSDSQVNNYANVFFKNVQGFSLNSDDIIETDSKDLFSGNENFKLTKTNTFLGLSKFTLISNNFRFQIKILNENEIFLSTTAQVEDFKLAVLVVNFTKQCSDYFFYSETDKKCRLCASNCRKCLKYQVCQECKKNFTLSEDKSTCQCKKDSVNNICYDFNSTQMKGCKIAYFDSDGFIKCKFCSIIDNLVLNGSRCECKENYQLNNQTQKCQEICGDSIIIESECDDGNNKSNDGCSSICKLEPKFQCDSSSGVSVCRSKMKPTMAKLQAWKNNNNSAVFTIEARQRNLPFPFSFQDFANKEGPKMLNLTTFNRQQGKHTQLETQILSVKQNQIELLVNFDFTIENQETILFLNLSGTRYAKTNDKIRFYPKGANKALVYSRYQHVFGLIQVGMLVLDILMLTMLLAGLLAPKFIGLEANLIIQLTYLSQLLIKNPSQIPVGFSFLTALKYSMGLNQLFQLSTYAPVSDTCKKYLHLQMKKTVLENYGFSFAILMLATIPLAISSLMRYRTSSELLNSNSSGTVERQGKLYRNNLRNNLTYWNNVSERCFCLLTQIAFWNFMQVLNAIAVYQGINNKYVIFLETHITAIIGALAVLIALVLVLYVGVSHTYNIMCSDQVMANLGKRPSELLYKQITFVYIFIMGFLTTVLHEATFLTLPMSIYVLMTHFIYIIILLKIDPYQFSLNIHRCGLIINQIGLLIVLCFINAINYLEDMDELQVIVLGCFLLIFFFFVFILTGVRLYFEYRYGQKLEKQASNKRKQKESGNLWQLQLYSDLQIYRIQAQQRLTELERQRLKNPYFIENILMQDKMEDYVLYLQRQKKHWTIQMKEKDYFQNFVRKPLVWLKKNDKVQYERWMKIYRDRLAAEKKKSKKNEADPELQKVREKLKKQLKCKQLKQKQTGNTIREEIEMTRRLNWTSEYQNEE